MLAFLTDLYTQVKDNPVIWLVLTLTMFMLGQYVYRLTHFNPLAVPINTAVISIIIILVVFHVPYEQYYHGASFISFLLGPATVVLAVPVYEQRAKLIKMWLPLSAGLIVGCIVSMLSVIFLGWLLHLNPQTLISMIPKSVTTPIAMGVSQNLGGLPDLTAALVVITGIIGSIIGRPIFRFCKITSEPVCGVALGLSAHGMGTSMAFQISNDAGAFSGLAMGISGVITAFLAPVLAIPVLNLLGIH